MLSSQEGQVDLTGEVMLVILVSMEYVTRLFGEAWAHHRRRQRNQLSAALLVAVLGAAVYAAHPFSAWTGSTAGIGGPPRAVAEPPSAVFSQPPYMGVRCAAANSLACDRVGLAVWLRRPAVSVVAWIDNRRVLLNWFGDQRIAPPGLRTAFDGYLHPAGLVSRFHLRPSAGSNVWLGDHAPSPIVRLLIGYGNGRHVLTQLRVPLAAGWG
jgi:hypothetical protein